MVVALFIRYTQTGFVALTVIASLHFAVFVLMLVLRPFLRTLEWVLALLVQGILVANYTIGVPFLLSLYGTTLCERGGGRPAQRTAHVLRRCITHLSLNAHSHRGKQHAPPYSYFRTSLPRCAPQPPILQDRETEEEKKAA